MFTCLYRSCFCSRDRTSGVKELLDKLTVHIQFTIPPYVEAMLP